jgi:hypothetical protein
VTLKGEHKLQVFVNKMLRKTFQSKIDEVGKTEYFTWKNFKHYTWHLQLSEVKAVIADQMCRSNGKQSM